jgi:hypothetical protein
VDAQQAQGNKSARVPQSAEADYDKRPFTSELRTPAFNPLLLTPLSFTLAPTFSERTPGKKASPLGGSPGFGRGPTEHGRSPSSWPAASSSPPRGGVENVNPIKTLVRRSTKPTRGIEIGPPYSLNPSQRVFA